MNLDTFIAFSMPKIEKALSDILSPLQKNPDPLLFEAASYSLLNPGKRLRPLLTLVATHSLGEDPEKALYPASAIEILHTYSLIHDDLPCMDDDDLRRGKPTLHKMYPEGQAVLTGDLLLTLAFETLSLSPGLKPDQTLELIKILAKKSGGSGMILGQSLDLKGENSFLSWDRLCEIHYRKTADLIGASLEFAAVLSEKPSFRGTFCEIGKDIGLSFQIIDDVLDIEGEEHIIGKSILSDLENKKSTSVSLLGLPKAKEMAKKLLNSALEKCESIGLGTGLLAELLPRLVHRNF